MAQFDEVFVVVLVLDVVVTAVAEVVVNPTVLDVLVVAVDGS